MGKYQDEAKNLLELVGGKENFRNGRTNIKSKGRW